MICNVSYINRSQYFSVYWNVRNHNLWAVSHLLPIVLMGRGRVHEVGCFLNTNEFQPTVFLLLLLRACILWSIWLVYFMFWISAIWNVQIIVLHYKSDGTASLSFTYKKRQYFAPVVLILKALKSECDKYIYDRLMDGQEDDTYYAWYFLNFHLALIF